MTPKQYFQCRLEREESPGTVTVTVGWIEARGAKVGAEVELLPSKQLWKVAKVFDHAVPEDTLKKHQRLNRGSLPSVEKMGP